MGIPIWRVPVFNPFCLDPDVFREGLSLIDTGHSVRVVCLVLSYLQYLTSRNCFICSERLTMNLNFLKLSMSEQPETTQIKILIVEDEGIIADDLKSCVDQSGYTVLACVNFAKRPWN